MPEKKSLSEKLMDYVDGDRNTWFEYFILVIILINVVTLGLETSALKVKTVNFLHLIDQICLTTFVVELIIKFIAFKKDFFKYGWNIFDFVIVITALIATLPCVTALRALRIIRTFEVMRATAALRTIKILKFVAELKVLQNVLRAMLIALKGVIWTFFLLVIIYYIYAIIGTHIFGYGYVRFFGNIGKSMLSLFQIMTGDSWCSQIARPIITAYPWAWIYFTTFICLTTFIIMNIIVAIIVNSVEEIRSAENLKKIGLTTVTIPEIDNKINELKEQIQKSGIAEISLPDMLNHIIRLQEQVTELNNKLIKKEDD